MTSTWKQWRCHECGQEGREIGAKATRIAFERHWVSRHQEVPF